MSFSASHYLHSVFLYAKIHPYILTGYSQSLFIIIILLLETFSHQRYLMIVLWSLSDSNCSHVSRTLLSTLADLNSVVVWMISTPPLISTSSSPFSNPSVTVPRAPIIIDINVTYMFHGFFQFSSKCWGTYDSFQFFWILICGPPEQQKSINLQILFFVDYYKIWSSGP